MAVLQETVFGTRIAEDEVDELHTYFVETDQWKKLLSGAVDIVFGSKGSGKSALYSLLVAQTNELRVKDRTLFLPAENPRGTPVFRELSANSNLSEENFRSLWKLYFLSISANYLRHHLTTSKIKNQEANEVFDLLSEYGLLAPGITLLTRLKIVLEYLRKLAPSFEGSVTDPTGVIYGAKITFEEPSVEERNLGYRSLDNLLTQLNNVFSEYKITVWLVLDRLDVAFADSETLETVALRSLFRAYLDMLSLSHIKVKIFLRDDIWSKIVNGGFREASHITRSITLSWDQRSLLNLIVRRLASNESVCKFYNTTQEEVLKSAEQQSLFFYKVFPPQVDVGKSKPKTLDWMLSRTADGTKRTAPREVIHLLLAAKDEQLKLDELGSSDREQLYLIGNSSIRSGLLSVSKARFEQTLCAEKPLLQPYLQKLERQKTQQTSLTLSTIWGCSNEQAKVIIEQLVEAGFFERRGTREKPVYWVPMLYRGALKLIQGSA